MISDFSFLQEFFDFSDKKAIELNGQKKVVVGLSGGVDSSVAALILKAQGYQVIGVFMKNWEEEGDCSAEEDYQDVIKVCELIDIPYYSMNFSLEYKERVFNYFIDEYQLGRTPNPDILCNREIKFDVFFKKVMKLGADYLATGHYAKTSLGKLLKAKDNNKDQTYFLSALKALTLEKVLFPLGTLDKSDVRKIAEYYQLANAKKKDSTGVCFIGERNFKDFLKDYIKSQKGSFIELETGKILGEHDGQCFYTKGQRKGLGVGGPGRPWFVAEKDSKTNAVFLVQGEQHKALYTDELWAKEVSWVDGKTPFEEDFICQAKLRYRQSEQECEVRRYGDEGLHVKFLLPQRAVTEEQVIVFYQGDICLGCAVIDQVKESFFYRDS